MKTVSFGKLARMIYTGETDAKPNCYPDKMICKKDGSVEFRKTYFYTMGRTARTWADNIVADFANAGIAVEPGFVHDTWQAWPKDSYFSVTVRPVSSKTRFLIRIGKSPQETEIWQETNYGTFSNQPIKN
jgi:hypothetical protein